MPSCNDCLGPSGLTRDEIAAIARDVYLTGMLRRFGLEGATAARERLGPEMRAATARCGACRELRRCRRFLLGMAGDDAPSAFCPNAALFEELGRRTLPARGVA